MALPRIHSWPSTEGGTGLPDPSVSNQIPALRYQLKPDNLFDLPATIEAAADTVWNHSNPKCYMMGMNTNMKNTLYQDGAEFHFRTAQSGWLYFKTWWESVLDALVAGGHTMDIFAADLEGVAGFVWHTDELGSTLQAQILTWAASSLVGLPTNVDYSASFNSTTYAGERARIAWNDYQAEAFIRRVHEVFYAPVLERWPNCRCGNYDWAEYAREYYKPKSSTSAESQYPKPTYVGPTNISCPVLYQDEQDAKQQLLSIKSHPSLIIPWLTTNNYAPEYDGEFTAILGQCEDREISDVLFWA